MAHDGFRAHMGRNPVFECGCCGRNTRRTDQGNSSLCPQCDEWTMQENAINDGNYSGDDAGLASAEAFILKMKREAVKRGGNAGMLGL